MTYKITKQNAKAWVEAQTRHCAMSFETIFDVPGFEKALTVKVDRKGWRARGGIKNNKPFVKFSLKSTENRVLVGNTRFTEYGSIAKSPHIGTYNNGTVEGALLALIIHELAHALDYWLMYKGSQFKETVEAKIPTYESDGRTRSRGGHGSRWKGIYHYARQHLLNNGYSTVQVSDIQPAPKKRRQYKKKYRVATRKTGEHTTKVYWIEGREDVTVVAEQDWKGGRWYISLNLLGEAYRHLELNDFYGERERDGRKVRKFANKTLDEAINEFPFKRSKAA